MENYSFNLNELVISDKSILRKTDALRLYNAIAVFYTFFTAYLLYKIIQQAQEGGLHWIIYTFCLLLDLFFLFWIIKKKKEIKSSAFSINGVTTIIVKRIPINSNIRALLPIATSIILENETGNSQKYRIHLDENSLNALIFELIDRNVKIEER